MQQKQFDAIIMGAGWVGLAQARHLQMNLPGISIALIDPRPTERTDKDLKIGESMVEMGTMLLINHLGLMDYMLENHPPKFGLNFHWPKDPEKTESMDDYTSSWTRSVPPYQSYQMNRAKLETDLLKMCMDDGAEFFQGRVRDVVVTEGEEKHQVTFVRNNSEEAISLECQHLVDAAGRAHILGRKLGTLVKESESLMGLGQGASWVRVRNVDRKLFHGEFKPKSGLVSHYYATNHFFGDGYWFWMIPTDIEKRELSVGLMHHPDKVPTSELNSREKLLSFLKKEHRVLYDITNSGDPVDFCYWKDVPVKSKQIYSENNWYAVGDASSFFDAFYSYGTSSHAYSILAVTKLIQSKRRGDKDVSRLFKQLDRYHVETFFPYLNATYADHQHHLGKAGLMSWRIAWDANLFFHIHLGVFVGEWHTDADFVEKFSPLYRTIQTAHEGVNKILTNYRMSGKPDVAPVEIYIFLVSSLENLGIFQRTRDSFGLSRVNPFESLYHTLIGAKEAYASFVSTFEGEAEIEKDHHQAIIRDLLDAAITAKKEITQFSETRREDGESFGMEAMYATMSKEEEMASAPLN